MPFSAILLVFKFLMFSFLQVCKFTDLQVHNSIDCPYFYGLSVKISDLLHLFMIPQSHFRPYTPNGRSTNTTLSFSSLNLQETSLCTNKRLFTVNEISCVSARFYDVACKHLRPSKMSPSENAATMFLFLFLSC